MLRTITAYLAGPDVFFPEAVEHAGRKVEICERYGIAGRPPLDEELAALLRNLPRSEAWRAILIKDLGMMTACDACIANLTPFMGASADAGTLIEVGWFLGAGKPVFGYTNDPRPFADRVSWMQGRLDSRVAWLPEEPTEDFGLADNLMVDGAVEHAGGLPIFGPTLAAGEVRIQWGLQPGHPALAHDYLGVFERCVRAAAARLGAGGAAPAKPGGAGGGSNG